jgi:TolA-binding protein
MGCQQMDAVTYPDPKVIQFFAEHLAPVRVLISSKPLPQQFNVNWTPTLVTLDKEGAEHHRTVGFLPPEELIPSLMLGIAKSHFDHQQFETAQSEFTRMIEEYPGSDAAPEAVYFQGVCAYKVSGDLTNMAKAYRQLQAKYKGSEWTKRATVYQKL